MRVIAVDQFEFPNPSSEESLEIAIAVCGPFPYTDAAQFLKARLGARSDGLAPPVLFSEHFAYHLVRPYLRQFAGQELPEPCEWPTYVIADGPDEWRLVLCGPSLFIDYRWNTTA